MRDFTTRDQVAARYGWLAPYYDRASRVLNGLGFRYERLRRDAVRRLDLQPGDTVVEIGCGTGANFPLLEQRIGTSGRIIGVDLTPAMLDQARTRAAEAGWENIELIESSASAFRFPEDGVDAVLSTFALALEPKYDTVIARIATALRPGRRFAIADIKLASGWTRVFVPFLLPFVRPFAVSLELADRHPWESMRAKMSCFEMTESLGGYLYVASATPARHTSFSGGSDDVP